MKRSIACLFLALTLLAGVFSAHTARAAQPYQGIYVLIDPYAKFDVSKLKTAATTPCEAGKPSKVTPFCTAANGILLRFPWCDFQLYHVLNTHKQPYPSCHYTVGYSGGLLQHGVQMRFQDMVSPCPGTYDTCAGQQQSTIATALSYIVQINAQRAAIGLPPINLAIGMYPGIGTPQTIFDTLGYVDVPYLNPVAPLSANNKCFRLPLPWTASFLGAYEGAIDQLVAYMQSQMPQGMNITVFKAAAITATDLEVDEPGQPNSIQAPADPGPGVGPLLNCTGAPGAQTWLNAYNAAPNPGENFSQANEAAFGAIIGHLTGLAANIGDPAALISIATTNYSAFTYVDCGVTGAAACQVDQNPSPWSTYYFETYTGDLFNGGLAYSAAAAAYAQLRNDTFSLPARQVAVNSTDLGQNAPVSAQEQPCIINNTNPANDPTYLLNGVNATVMGAGTVIGWQTKFNEGKTCSGGGYSQTLTNGINEGSLYEEVQTDAAFTHLGSCSTALSNALTQLLAASPPTSCVYK